MNTPASASASIAVGELNGRIENGVRRARALKRPVVVYISPLPGGSPLAAFQSGEGAYRTRWFWADPNSGAEFAGLGTSHEISAEGPTRFESVRQAWESLVDECVVGGEAGAASGPMLFGGFSFRPRAGGPDQDGPWNGFPDARFVLPEVMVGRTAAGTLLTVNAVVDAESDPNLIRARLERGVQTLTSGRSRVTGEAAGTAYPATLQVTDAAADEWKESVRRAVRAIESGRFEKAVLARSVLAEAPWPFDPSAVLRSLGAAYPTCYRFAIESGSKCFVGSSPELLASRRGPEVHSMALAGSHPRGGTPEADRELGERLLHDPKNRAEHAIVAEHVRAALRPLCERLKMPAEPQLLKLENVQHLYTPVIGRLSADHSVVEIVERLHPTPAVGGHPPEAALECIAACERLDRGWYAGPIGAVDAVGNGAFAVAIRSALIEGCRATLFAGCGIVRGSDPEAEFAESRLKLKPLLASLGRTGR